MGSRSKRMRSRGSGKKRWYYGLVRPISDIFNDQGEKIGLIGRSGTIYINGTMPETILDAMIGRRLSEVIVRHDLCRDVRITMAHNVSADHWFIKTAGHPVLPAKIAAKRKREAARGLHHPNAKPSNAPSLPGR